MKPIDFDRRFQLYALDWLRRHPGLKEDEVDARYNEMLAEWREKPADWLDGRTPADYFQQFDDPAALSALLERVIEGWKEDGVPERELRAPGCKA